MNPGKLMGDFVKEAISDELKYKAMVERSARGLAVGKSHWSELGNMPFPELTTQPGDKNIIGGILNGPGPQSYLSKNITNHDADHNLIDKYRVWDEVDKSYPIKGPNVHTKLENSYRQKAKAIPSYIDETVGKDIKNRATQISDAASDSIRRKSFATTINNVANDNSKRLPNPAVNPISKPPSTIGLGKKMLIGAGVLGAGYGAKKLYDHFSEKNAHQKGFPDKYESHKETIKNALPHLRAAKANKTAMEDSTKDKLLGGAATYGGVAALTHPSLKKNITGRETLYHGTAPDYIPSIKEKGLIPSANRGSTDMLENINPEAAKASRNMTFVTPNKPFAREYAVKGQDVKKSLDEYRDMGLKVTPGLSAQENTMWQAKAQWDPEIQMRVANPFNNKGIIEASVPTWQDKLKLQNNPETAPGRKAIVEKLKSLGTSPIQANMAFNMLDQAKGIEGGLGPEFIKGSPSYNKLSLKEMGQYMKAKPGRFAKGVGLGALGAGALGYGANKLYNAYTKEASLSEQILDNAGLAILAAPSVGHLMRREMDENTKSKMELGGLGVLAAHPTYEIAQAGAKKLAPSMMNAVSPIANNMGRHFQAGNLGAGLAQGASGLFNKIRPMLKLGHAAFYGNILKMI